MTRLEDLEKRLEALEHELALLRELVLKPPMPRTRADHDIEMLREARANQAAIRVAVAEAFAHMGITGEPVGPVKLKEMMAACGIRPEDNLFSREIAAMRRE